ncbi:MAG: phosphotransferase family protein [Candidatus Xenobia bacterium]
MIDTPRAVRAGEELDLARLAPYLETLGLSGPLAVQQFPSGFSNLTYLLRVGEREVVLRRPPFGSEVRSAHDMGREFRILDALIRVFPKVPCPIAYCEDLEVLGVPFYLMERVPGVILRDRAPDNLRPVSEAAVDLLADIHDLDPIPGLGRGEGYVERQIRGWSERYLRARTDDVPQLEQVAAWLLEQMPASAGTCVIHNDYKYDNLVLNPDDLSDIRAVLDWEMATVGDPLMDLGTSLGYWIEADDPPALRALPFSISAQPGNLTRAEVVARYAARRGITIANWHFYYAYGLFKIAVVAQQIYARYKQGRTRDDRFANLIMAVRILGTQAHDVLGGC